MFKPFSTFLITTDTLKPMAYILLLLYGMDMMVLFGEGGLTIAKKKARKTTKNNSDIQILT